MDYSKYYLRNYRRDEERPPSDAEIPYDGTSEQRHVPEIVYINPDGEEFFPQPPSADARPDKTGKKPFLTRFVINVLVAVVVILSLFVSVDFITDGGLVEEVTRLIYDEKPYYAVLELPADSPEEAILNSQTLRIGGKAGYPVRYDGKYYCVADLFDNDGDAEKSLPPSGASIYELTLTPPELPEEYEKFIERPHRLFDALKETEEKLLSGQAGISEAISDVKALYEIVLTETDELKSMSNDRATKAILEFVSDYSVALAALEMLCDDNVTVQSYVSDLKYARCQIMFAFAL